MPAKWSWTSARKGCNCIGILELSPRLFVLEGDVFGTFLPVGRDSKQLIGRKEPADVRVPDASVSESQTRIAQ